MTQTIVTPSRLNFWIIFIISRIAINNAIFVIRKLYEISESLRNNYAQHPSRCESIKKVCSYYTIAHSCRIHFKFPENFISFIHFVFVPRKLTWSTHHAKTCSISQLFTQYNPGIIIPTVVYVHSYSLYNLKRKLKYICFFLPHLIYTEKISI